MNSNNDITQNRLDTGRYPIHKKILFVSNEGSFSGAPLFLVRLVRYLQVERPEYKIAIFFSGSGDLVEILAQNGFEIFFSEKHGNPASKISRIWFRFIHYFKYIKALFAYRPDLVYSNTIVNSGEVILAGLGKRPVLLHMHEGKNFSCAYRKKLKISCLFTKRIIVGSHYVNTVLHHLTGRTGVVAHNGVDSPTEFPVKQRQSDAPLKIGVLGTINSNKGQLIALEAMRLLVERGLKARLKIAGMVGDFEYSAELDKFVKLNSLEEYVDFVGVVPDVNLFLNSLDLLVVPSFDEAFPTVVLEAFSTGTLVVASDVGGIPEMIENKVNGFLFKAGDAVELTDILEKIINNGDILDDMPRSAFKILKERFELRATNHFLAMTLDEMLLGAKFDSVSLNRR